MPAFIGTRRALRNVVASSSSSAPIVTLMGTDFSTSAASTYTFSGKDFGTAASNRRIIVGVRVRDTTFSGNVTAFTSLSIDGTNGTTFGEATIGDGFGGWGIRNVTSGTSGDIVVNLDNAGTGCHIAWWVAYMSSNTTFFADSSQDSGSSVAVSFGGTPYIPATGFGLAMAASEDTSDRAFSINNGFDTMTEVFSGQNSAFSQRIATGSEVTSATTVTITSGSGTNRLFVASWEA